MTLKILTVLVLCIVCCVNAYTIFPLPGQSLASNPKFGSFTPQTTKSTQLNSRLASAEPRPFQSQTSKIPEVNIGNFAHPFSNAQSTVPSRQSMKSVEILNSASNQAKIVNPSSFVQNHQNFVPMRPNTAVEQPFNDLLPPKEETRPGVASTTVRPRPVVEAPFNDLLPPKNK